jgi:hypothetical protein
LSDEGFSWAPFGPSQDEVSAPLPPLPPLPGETESEPSLAVPSPPPMDVTPEVLPFEVVEEEASEPPPAFLPEPVAPAAAPAGPWGQLAAPGDIVPDKRVRPQVKGGGDAAAALIWGILGLTICPILIPSIVAIRKGAQAKAAGGGLGGNNLGMANWGIGLGWTGVILWAIVIAAGISSI